MTGQYIARSPAIAARRLGTSMIIMSAEDSTLFTLSETATAIWQAAGGQTPLDQYRRREGLRRIRRRSRAGICRTQKASHRILLLSGKPKGAIRDCKLAT